jgi:hypothetical protein
MIKILLLAFLLYGCSTAEIELSGNIANPATISSEGRLDSILTSYRSEAAFLIAADGTAAYLPASSYPYLYLYKSDGEFHAQSDSLPAFCNLKNISEISLYSPAPSYSLSVLQGNQSSEIYTPFSARLAEFRLLGASSRYGNYASKYESSSPFRLPALEDSILTLTNDGKYIWYDRTDFSHAFSLQSNHFKLEADTLIAIWQNPPQQDIFSLHNTIDTYPSPLLVIIIDSYGHIYHQHLAALGEKNYLHDLDVQPLRSAYPPKSRYNIWALGSGDRLQNRNEARELFNFTTFENSVFLGGAIRLFAKEIEFVSAIDTLRYNDYAIFRQAAERIHSDKYDLIFVHFVSIDEAGHDHGAYSIERLEQTKLVTSYIEELVKLWNGDVLFVSDHGMHDKDGKGTHFRAIDEDIIGIWGMIK